MHKTELKEVILSFSHHCIQKLIELWCLKIEYLYVISTSKVLTLSVYTINKHIRKSPLLYRSFTFFSYSLKHSPMSSFICLLAVESFSKSGQSISPRLDIHSTGMKHEGIKKSTGGWTKAQLNSNVAVKCLCGLNPVIQVVNADIKPARAVWCLF